MSKFGRRYGKQFADTARLALPVAAGQIGYILIGMTDTYMVGKLGKTQLAAGALASSLFFLICYFGYGVCMGVAPVVANALGRKDHKAVAALLPQSVWVSIGTSVVMMILVSVVNLIIPYMGQKDPLVPGLTQEFLWVITASCLPMLVCLALRNYVDAFDRTWPGMLVTYSMVVTNGVLNYGLIFGHWGLPHMGFMGSAWATFFSRVAGMLLMAGYIMAAPKFRPMVRSFFIHIRDWRYSRDILKVGIPTGGQFFFEALAFSLALVMMGTLGSAEQSAHSIALQLAAFTYMIYSGISAAAAIRTGKAFGAKDWRGSHDAGVSALLLGCVVMLVCSACLYFFRFIFPPFFIKEGETDVVALAARLLAIGAIFQVFDGTQAIMQGALRGINDVRLPVIFSMIAYLLIGLPAGWFLGLQMGMGAEGIWYGLTLGLAISASFLTVRFLKLSGPAGRAASQKSHGI